MWKKTTVLDLQKIYIFERMIVHPLWSSKGIEANYRRYSKACKSNSYKIPSLGRDWRIEFNSIFQFSSNAKPIFFRTMKINFFEGYTTYCFNCFTVKCSSNLYRKIIHCIYNLAKTFLFRRGKSVPRLSNNR